MDTTSPLPRRPRSAALVDFGVGGESASGVLLADLADALAAYERIGGIPEGRRIAIAGVLRATGCPDAALAETARDADAVVIGCSAEEGSLPARAADLLGVLDRLHPNATAYAIATCTACGPAAARDALSELAELVGRKGLAWGGGVAAGGADLVAAAANAPRMGFWRRWTSEATDELIAAIRCGDTVEHLHGYKDGVIEAKPPLPQPLYNLAVKLLGRTRS